ncbi:MAG: hypothetical protein A3F70_08980 [Acidobacteria bacterium RIFCSPLOWO2_12_FULL_67_14]|nr:MAG: hypothetical protein A3H29_12645 [Acidobacteria bacterium RIFCSPLOWO2_02_FULL_67_21]OFW40040.1 MAG: hypothetical protein A3F70_08980 [Acidobacteria bacterium RIFCSPLOWO2_12_FULL_67_14]
MRREMLACVAALLIAGPAQAHHSIVGVYDSARSVTVEGAIVRFEFIYPHPFVVLDVRRSGATDTWRLEMDNRGELADVGFANDTLRPGDRVVVSGNLARQEPNRLYIRRLERPSDGLLYEQVGMRPQLRRGR